MFNYMRYICSGDVLAPQCQVYQAPPKLESVEDEEGQFRDHGAGGWEETKRLANHDKFAGYVSKLSIGMTITCFVIDEIPE